MPLGCETSNDCGYVKFHSQSLRGSVIDLIIHFHRDESVIENVLDRTLDLFLYIHEQLKRCTYKARLIAHCEYHRINAVQDVIEKVSYHFASYSAERVTDANAFYARHLQKIASRMDSFHQRGSNLIFQRIKHIHIALSIESGCIPDNFIEYS